MRPRFSRPVQALAGAAAAMLTLGACATVVDGSPAARAAPNANLPVVGGTNAAFDTTVKNAISDVIAFWKINYPSIANGAALPPIKGGFYSVDGQQVVDTGEVNGPAAKEGCIARSAKFIVNNAAFCFVDDSIVWDRAPQHLVPVLANKYGSLLVALAFAHEFGHALQYRTGDYKLDLPTIDFESQADCAAGAFLASVQKNQAPHFRASPAQLDQALNGYLQVRDSTPASPDDLSHGNGFDRLSAVEDGAVQGPTYCYAKSYFNRKFTERPFVSDTDYESGGNETLAQVLNPAPLGANGSGGGGGLQPDLNRFWKAAAQSIGKSWQDVKIAEAAHPKCGASSTSEFGYCPDDNTVYYSDAEAARAYNSLADKKIDPSTHNVSLLENQPADFALGTLFAVGWGLAVRHQLFSRTTDDAPALLAASCYTGAYSKDVNLETGDATHKFILSPPDMDEATSAMLNLVGDRATYGARGTTGLQRIQSFVKGYNGGLSVC
jgi:predicted metalloprotease